MRVGEPAGTATHSQESAAAVGTDLEGLGQGEVDRTRLDQESLLTLVVLFDQADGVEACVLDVGVPNPCFRAAPRVSMRQGYLDIPYGRQDDLDARRSQSGAVGLNIR